MAHFSTAVKLGDLNDFIAPSQACVVSLQGQKQATSKAPTSPKPDTKEQQDGLQLNARSNKRSARTDATSNNAVESATKQTGFKQTVVDDETQAIKVSLNDCLACSGCVTSAETVLLQHQSLKEFQAKCEDPDTIVVVSISPQSRASLAAFHGLDAADVQGRLSSFLKMHLSVALVLDIGLGSTLALTEAAKEFVDRYQQSHGLQGPTQPAAAAAAAAGAIGNGGGGESQPLPMLASACPGWVCYAEKTHGSYILPHISTTRSPQGVMGALVKQLLARFNGWDPAQIYHVTVMPCYDKKLEASRDDFLVPGTAVAEVDSCLTTGEVQELLEKYGFKNLADIPGGRHDNLAQQLQQGHLKQQQQQQQPSAAADLRLQEPALHSLLGSSGGYAQHIFKAAAKHLYAVDLSRIGTGLGQLSQLQSGQLPFKALRNADLQELQLLGPSGEPLMRFAIAYGFRNIQTLVRKIKSGRCEYDYIEVMACPSGCLNGGGQLKAAAGVTAAQHIEQLEMLYFQQQNPGQQQREQQQQQDGGAVKCIVAPGVIQLQNEAQRAAHVGQERPANSLSSNINSNNSSSMSWAVPDGVSCDAVEALYTLLQAGLRGADVSDVLHTSYHKREKTVSSTLADW